MSEKFDDVPEEFWGDPTRIWQVQISGENNFDDYSFMGCLNGFQSDPEWRSVFDPIKDETGMQAFLDRLQGHFDLCKSPMNKDGSQFLYMHPSRTDSKNLPEKAKLIALVKRHMQTMVKALDAAGQPENADKLRGIDISWADPEYYNSLEFDEQRALWDGKPLGFYLSEAWDFTWYLDGAPEIRGCLYEAVYSLANDFALTRYLMQSFMDHGLDVDAEYELKWKHKGVFYFDETACYVTVEQ